LALAFVGCAFFLNMSALATEQYLSASEKALGIVFLCCATWKAKFSRTVKQRNTQKVIV